MAFGWFESRQESRAAGVLLDPASPRSPVQVEIENTRTRFATRLFVHNDGSIVLHKPEGMDDLLRTGVYVRLRFSDADPHQLRLRIVAPHLNLKNGKAAFVCRAQDDVMTCRRKADRFEVVQYRNLRLSLGNTRYRVADLSANGLRIALVGIQKAALFPIGQALEGARLELDGTPVVDFSYLTPRNHHRRMVGCEFHVSPEPASRRRLQQVLESIRQAPTGKGSS